MKNSSLEKLVRKFALTGLLSAAALGPMKAAESPSEVKEEKGIKVEITLLPPPQGISLNENGSFNEIDFRKDFAKLNYQEKVPQILEIYKDVKKNGFTVENRNKLISLFPENKQVAKAIHSMNEGNMKTALKAQTGDGLGGVFLISGLFVTAFGLLHAGASESKYNPGFVDLESKEALFFTVIPIVVGVALLISSAVNYDNPDLKKIISSEEKMADALVLYQKNLDNEYAKKIREVSPDVIRNIRIMNTIENSK